MLQAVLLSVKAEYTEHGAKDLTVIYNDRIHGVVLRLETDMSLLLLRDFRLVHRMSSLPDRYVLPEIRSVLRIPACNTRNDLYACDKKYTTDPWYL